MPKFNCDILKDFQPLCEILPLLLCNSHIKPTEIFADISSKKSENQRFLFAFEFSRLKVALGFCNFVIFHQKWPVCKHCLPASFGFSKTRQLSTQNINLARFTRNVECDFLGNFQALCLWLNNFEVLILINARGVCVIFDQERMLDPSTSRCKTFTEQQVLPRCLIKICCCHSVWKSLKMSHLNFRIRNFPPIFVVLKLTYLVTPFGRNLHFFKNLQNWPFLGSLMNFCPLKMWT